MGDLVHRLHHQGLTGVDVTAHAPSRDAVLACLRIAITRTKPFGPVGGLPGQIRVDRGKEFLCATVTAAMGALAVPVTDLPAYSPHLKGTIEALNDAVEEMFLVSLPRYTGRQEQRSRLVDRCGEGRGGRTFPNDPVMVTE